jgi:hypothetical protein
LLGDPAERDAVLTSVGKLVAQSYDVHPYY